MLPNTLNMSTACRRLSVVLLFALLLVYTAHSALPIQAASQVIYTDELAANWLELSWADVNLKATSPVHAGNYSIKINYGATEGFFLRHPGVLTTGFTHVRFFIHGGSAGGQKLQLYAVRASDPHGEHGPEIAFPEPAAGTWREVRVALTDLQAADTTITGLVWQGRLERTQPVLYIDDIALVSNESPDGPVLSNGDVVPRAVPANGTTGVVVRMRVTDPQGAADISQVTLDARSLGRGTVVLRDDGWSSDGAANDGTYGAVFSVAAGTAPGEHMLLVTAQDRAGHRNDLTAGAFVVFAPPGGTTLAALPQPIGWGTSEWNEDTSKDWQVKSGVPWNYVYQVISYEWYTGGWGEDFVGNFVRQAWEKNYIPVVSVYMFRFSPPSCGEGAECYAQKLKNATAVRTYLTALQEAARQARGTKTVIFHLEPDFSAFLQQLSNREDRPSGVRPDDPTSYPVALNISGYPNTLAGFGKRMVDVIHNTASNALVAPQANLWATDLDPNVVTGSRVASLAERTAKFIDAMGGAESDLYFTAWSDQDAGGGKRPWWDETNHTLPYHNRAVQWANALSVATGKRIILWRVPVGNKNLNNTCDHYQDNRVAYSFSHIRDLVDAGIVAVMYGPGATCMTAPSTDGGFLASQASIAYANPAAPEGLVVGPVNGPGVPFRWTPNSEVDLWGYELQYRLNGSSTWQKKRVERANATTVVFPVVGTWQVRLVAFDALGQTSAPSAETQVTISAIPAANRVFLPLVGR